MFITRESIRNVSEKESSVYADSTARDRRRRMISRSLTVAFIHSGLFTVWNINLNLSNVKNNLKIPLYFGSEMRGK